jgi:hypothetical protein
VSGRAEAHPFRVAVLVLFIGAALSFIGVLAVGIVRSLTEEMALAPPIAGGRESFSECATDLKALRSELEERLSTVHRTGHEAEELWDAWSAGWRRQLSVLEIRCRTAAAPDSPRGRAIAAAARDLTTLAGLYSTHVVQYAREIGGAVEQADRDFGALTEAARSGPPPSSDPPHR